MKSPVNIVDVYIGAKLRMRRVILGMSQSKLGELLGVTFQQVQKYEKGTNRISANRLRQASEALRVSIDYFYEGAPAPTAVAGGFAEPTASFDVSFLSTTEGLQLNRAFARIEDPKVRRKIVDLVVSLAPPEEDDEAVVL
jgi:transcriptional regulator with XRE-family HTH domain